MMVVAVAVAAAVALMVTAVGQGRVGGAGGRRHDIQVRFDPAG